MNKYTSIEDARKDYEPFTYEDRGHLRDRWITSGLYETKIIAIEGKHASFLNLSMYAHGRLSQSSFSELFEKFWFVTGDPNNWGSRVIGKLKK